MKKLECNTILNIIKELKNIDYPEYIKKHKINELPYINIEYGNIGFSKKIKKWETIDPDNQIPSPPEFDDLVRLHYLAILRKARVILEFGIGKSTSVLLDALKINEQNYKEIVINELRVTEPFRIYSVDNNINWIEKVSSYFINDYHFNKHFSECIMGEFNSRICTFYENLPNIRPDFIYLDGPSQFGVKGNVRGISTEHKDRMPMSADILAFEHFLEPGTLIVVDGRTANARFLYHNFQRNWVYHYEKDFDQHFFLLTEPPLGLWNEAALNFTNDNPIV